MFSAKTKNISEFIDVLKPCRVTYTLNSTYIKSELGDYYFTNNGDVLKPKEMSFVKQFRSFYAKNPDIKFDKRFVKSQPNFVKFYKMKGTYSDLVEVDIKRAYPTAGRILNIIPNELWEKGIQHSKGAFLVAIGSLYRRRRIIEVMADGKRKLIAEEKRDPKLSKLWLSMVGFTDYVMQKAVASKPRSVYFYWCDALFVKRQHAEHFSKILSEFGFETKTQEIDRLEFTEQKALVFYKGVNKPKEFGLPNRIYKADSLESVRKRYEKN